MNFQSDSGVKTSSGPACPTGQLEAGAQLGANIRPICSPGGTAQEAGERDENWLRRFEEARAKLAKLRGSKRVQPNLGWLARDPSEWTGRKIRNRLNGKVFVVRNVLINGQVELEKSWMTYLYYVWTIRADFETYS